MIWHFAATKCGTESSWLLIRPGYPALLQATMMTHHCVGAWRWWRLRDDGCLQTPVTDTVLRRLLSSPLIPLSVTFSSPVCATAARINPETNADQDLFPWIPGGERGACCKAFSLSPLCLETMILRPTPPPSSSLPLLTTRVSGVSWQMLSEACTHTQNTLCPRLFGLLRLTVVWV